MDYLNPCKALTKREHERLTESLQRPVTWPRMFQGFSTEVYQRNETNDRREG